MSTTDYLSVTDTAKLLRTALRTAHPGTKFSVRSSKYAGGASINVSWTDGPTAYEVDKTAKLYAGATFDGMQDLKEHHSTVLVDGDDMREVHFGADFVFTNRTVSQRALETACLCVRPSGHIHLGEQCAGCWNHMKPGPVWVARFPHEGRERIELVCSPICGARRITMHVDLSGF